MLQTFNVIALISGGKDSFYSLIHCLRHGHKVIALANLHPPLPSPAEKMSRDETQVERDLQSYMYQTTGHTIIPLYEEALKLPLYRQPILGTAVNDVLSYAFDPEVAAEDGTAKSEDETESLIPLLRRIMKEHPSANALCTGAILSTYQRTRIESVAGRLGLTSLAYCWKYPVLPPGTGTSLLEDMAAIGLQARIVKVASGGLDEHFLWEDVISDKGRRRVEKAMSRFGMDGDGAVLGEGGEFETIVLDGPRWLFKGRIEVKEAERRIVREGGGCAWLSLSGGRVVSKAGQGGTVEDVRIPWLLDRRLEAVLDALVKHQVEVEPLSSIDARSTLTAHDWIPSSIEPQEGSLGIRYFTMAASSTDLPMSIHDEASQVIASIKDILAKASLQPTDIVSTIIILRTMQDFAVINKIYSTLFPFPNPPSRVTISSGTLLPTSTSLIIHLKLHINPPILAPRKALHVQSTSYWAPANIGPYSQAISIPITSSNTEPAQFEASNSHETQYAVSTAGQIPLVPHTMALPTPELTKSMLGSNSIHLGDFKFQTVLALQHLWRIGAEMDVRWWTSVVAYIPRQSIATATREKSLVASHAWKSLHEFVREDAGEEEEEEEERDIWEERYNAARSLQDHTIIERKQHLLPDWRIVKSKRKMQPSFFLVEVEELPRASDVEWNAILGITSGSVELRLKERPGYWAVHQCVVGTMVQTVVMLYQQDIKVEIILAQALTAIGEVGEKQSYVSYLVMSTEINGLLDQARGIVPCRSIWDGSGRRLDAVLLFDTLSDIQA